MKNSLLIAIILSIFSLSVQAKPPAKDSVHGGTSKALLDNISPNALSGGSGGGGRWTGYEGLDGQQIGPVSVHGWDSKQCVGYAQVIDGRPYIYMVSGGSNLGWMQTEYAQSTICAAYLSPSGLTVNVSTMKNNAKKCCGPPGTYRIIKSLNYWSGYALWKR